MNSTDGVEGGCETARGLREKALEQHAAHVVRAVEYVRRVLQWRIADQVGMVARAAQTAEQGRDFAGLHGRPVHQTLLNVLLVREQIG